MQQAGVSRALLWSVRICIWMLLCTPLVVAPTWFFPYITGKNFFFRIVTELTFGLWLALIIVDARFRPKSGIVLWAFLAFIAVSGLATVFGADPYHSFWSNYERMEGMVTYLHLAALFLMASSVFRSIADWRLTFHLSLAISLIVAGYGFLELVGVVAAPGSKPGVTGIGIYSLLGNQIYLAAYLLSHFFILGFLFFTLPPKKKVVSGNHTQTSMVGGFTTRRMWWRAAYAFLGLFELYIFFHTGTRGALIGFAAGLAVFVCALFLFSLRDNKRLAFYMGTVVAAGIVAALGFFMLRESAFVARYLTAREEAALPA